MNPIHFYLLLMSILKTISLTCASTIEQPIPIEQISISGNLYPLKQISVKQNKQVITLFSHGLANTGNQVFGYTQNQEVIHTPFFTFDYSDATKQFWRVNFWNTNFGQKDDVKTLKKAYEKYVLDGEEKSADIILLGVSRGAVTALNFMAKHNPELVKAIIVESPFDHIESIAKQVAKKSRIRSNIIHRIMSIVFARYNPKGMHAINMVDKINKNLPILIICSKQDQRVPWQSSFNLYIKLQKVGHKKTHILVLDHGKHDNILLGKDGKKYQHVVHAFYKKYGLPYNDKYAHYGQEILTQCQPNIKSNVGFF